MLIVLNQYGEPYDVLKLVTTCLRILELTPDVSVAVSVKDLFFVSLAKHFYV
jgi:hypothetical protein